MKNMFLDLPPPLAIFTKDLELSNFNFTIRIK
jgi:hypothetical protein